MILFNYRDPSSSEENLPLMIHETINVIAGIHSVMILIRATEERVLHFFICPAAPREWNDDGKSLLDYGHWSGVDLKIVMSTIAIVLDYVNVRSPQSSVRQRRQGYRCHEKISTDKTTRPGCLVRFCFRR
jgi:hypothetical protein